ncbi:HoxN/HupN/NixA family nickel/cobalt transporter [Guptibacillus hwajinpoensis]|uniref:Nickel/cobalt efflux system n=1 Tax=Guptibacillus hwajinpoensis TaxID=208199 RepID=A0ABU0K9P6_9BACL|nr:urease accessory protein UreH [Alkalihalobacillus hemicentroti]MDQ0484842.1 ABC-type nickel/cobalt efflux system permease component RcnA [Alkalihalobacillus hemicentroti]
MDASLLSLLVIGFLLGIKHAIEPDHVIAVSTIASRTRSLWKSSLAGVYWGIGHTATLVLGGTLLLLFNTTITNQWAMSLELIVGCMLIFLGIKTLVMKKQKTEMNGNRTYIQSGFIGFVHGLAGSAAMILLTMSTVETLWQGVVYILIFGFGTCAGMLCFTTVLGIPFVATKRQVSLNKRLTQLTGILSVGFGFFYIYEIGVTGGLFPF